jgi:hypothetical protein
LWGRSDRVTPVAGPGRGAAWDVDAEVLAESGVHALQPSGESPHEREQVHGRADAAGEGLRTGGESRSVTRVGAGGGQMASGRCGAKSPCAEAGRAGARVRGGGPPGGSEEVVSRRWGTDRRWGRASVGGTVGRTTVGGTGGGWRPRGRTGRTST